ncbi:phage tail protein I [Pseudarthrobacter sulfonivorans]|uniref:phage tail protein I n=1 Tax=Pseudarthrobacter sulfonivorans TaxID=121292 RepID=UPI00210387D9|nr:phage tail protein I [Pseudarthrobacter sulfonivorans]
MYADRTLTLLVQPDQWARCAHEHTALLPGGGVVLDWTEPATMPEDDCAAQQFSVALPVPCLAGLAFDRWCRAYRSRPEAGRVDVFDQDGTQSPTTGHGTLGRPGALAVDRSQRLYVVEASGHAVLVVDLWAQRLLRRVPFGRTRPVDVAADCGRAAVLLRRPDQIVFLDGRRGPRPGPVLVDPCCFPGLAPTRITAHFTGGLLVLWRGGGHSAVASPDGTVQLEVEGATDIEATSNGLLVVARAPGQPFLRFQHDDECGWTELEPAEAPDFDGGALTISPAGRIVFTTACGFSSTAGSAARHAPSGSVVTYRLDSGHYHTRWGRVFLEACLPAGTGATLKFLTSEGEDVLDPVEATAPSRGSRPVPHPEQTPPLPSRELLDGLTREGTVFRRPNGPEQSWPNAPEGGFATYESQVTAAPGRYLWLKLCLTGTANASPRVRAIRIECPGHRLLNSLPRAWSRDDADADFLHRFLAPLEGTLHELEWRAAERAILLDPRTAPQEALPWLASFAGLVLDQRWPESARRTLVAEAYRLFTRRGTRGALIRMLELYLGRAPVIIEAWQLRGLGGMVLGAGPGGAAAPAVGGNARATGVLGRFAIGGVALPVKSPAGTSAAEPAGTGPALGQDSFQRSAHRFTLLVPGRLTEEQRAVVRSILDVHRPAHTVYEVCELGTGMRVGQRLHLNLTSFVGPDTGWAPAVLGQFRVGGDGIVGTPAAGSRVGDASVGQVRVG